MQVVYRRTGSSPELTLREIAPAAFLPPSLFAVGQGAIAPVVSLLMGIGNGMGVRAW